MFHHIIANYKNNIKHIRAFFDLDIYIDVFKTLLLPKLPKTFIHKIKKSWPKVLKYMIKPYVGNGINVDNKVGTL